MQRQRQHERSNHLNNTADQHPDYRDYGDYLQRRPHEGAYPGNKVIITMLAIIACLIVFGNLIPADQTTTAGIGRFNPQTGNQ